VLILPLVGLSRRKGLLHRPAVASSRM
jgi:hypothetical protein